MPDLKLEVGGKNISALFVAIPVAIVALAIIFILFGTRNQPPGSMPAQPVILEKVKTQKIKDAREFVAVVEADNIVGLKARVSGFLISKNFQEGDQVKAGQVLFQIEPDQYQALVDNAQANLISTQAQLDRASLDFNRINDLYTKKTTTKSDFDSSKAAFEVAQAAVMSAKASLTQAQLNLNYAAIKAPFDGTISDSPYSNGSLLGPESGVLATVVSTDPILVTFGISEKIITSAQNHASTIENPDEWQVRVRLTPTLECDQIGRLVYIAPLIDPQTDTVKFKAKFDNPNKLLKPGQIVTAILERAKPKKQLVVPKEGVLTDADGHFVYMTKAVPADPQNPNSKPGLVAEVRRVAIDQNDLEKDYIVLDGLKEGEEIIVKGLMSGGSTLIPGAPVQIVPPQAAEAMAGAKPNDESDKSGAKAENVEE